MRMVGFSICSLVLVGRGPDLGAGTLRREVGDLLGPLVDEEDHHVALGIVLEDAEGHKSRRENRLARAGRGRHRMRAAGCPCPDRAEEVDRAGQVIPAVSFISSFEVLVRGDGRQGPRSRAGSAAVLERRGRRPVSMKRILGVWGSALPGGKAVPPTRRAGAFPA